MRVLRILAIITTIFVSGCTVTINPIAKMYVSNNNVILVSGYGSYDFDTSYVNDDTNRATFQILSRGKKALKLTGVPNRIRIEGTNSSDFIADETLLKSTIQPNKSTAFAITFKPLSVGYKTALVRIYYNNEETPYYTFSLKGIAVTPEILVKQGNTTLVSGSSIVDFEEMYVGYSGSEKAFSIYNTGSGDLKLADSADKITISGTDASEFEITQTSTQNVVSPGSSTSFTIKVNPQSSGAKTAVISIANNDIDENPFTFTVKALAIDPGIIIMDSSQNALVNGSGVFDFGDVFKSDTKNETFTIKNLGSSNLLLTGSPRVTIYGSGANKYSINTQPSSQVLPGGSTTFVVKFTPEASNTFTVTLSIANNDVHDNPYTFTVKGRGVEPEINIQNSSSNNIASGTGIFNFSNTDVGKTKSETFKVQNLGGYNLLLDGSPKVSLSGSGASVFSVTMQPNSPVTPGSDTTFTVEFAPTDMLDYSAMVSISNNDSDENPYTFTVNGKGLRPEINVKQGTTDIQSGSGSYDFGTEYSGFAGASIVFTIENLGNKNLSLTGSPLLIAKSGTDAAMFVITQTSTTTPVNPGSSTTFSVVFHPTSVGSKSATISIASDDADENPYTFTVIGNAVPAAPEINVKQDSKDIPNSTGSYRFGSMKIGVSSKAVTFTIENLGVVNLNLNGSSIVELSGTHATEFSLDTNGTTTPVAPSGSTTFNITFTPTSEGTKTATVSISNNDSDENPYTFTIVGIGSDYIESDFNGDGIQDILVGAHNDDDGGVNAGCAFIFFGKNSWSSKVNASAADVKIIGENAGDIMGYNVSSAGDINDDGITDIVIGALQNDDGGNNAGKAYIFFGRQNWSSTIDASNADVKIVGNNIEDMFGYDVSGADINNDGFSDVIISATYDNDGGTHSGCVFIFFGKTSWSSSLRAYDADVKIIGASRDDELGRCLAQVGDVNNDGIKDFILCAPQANSFGPESGSAYLFLGKQNWYPTCYANTANTILYGISNGDYFGSSVRYAGDVNKDGYDDVLVGASSMDGGGTSSGCAFIFFGRQNWSTSISAASANVRLVGADTSDVFGCSVSNINDINNDGYQDIIVGALFDENLGGAGCGCAYVFYGRQNWSSSINATQADIMIYGENLSSYLGQAMSSAGDLNNDGKLDFMVTARNGNNGSGSVYLFYGKTSWSSTIKASSADIIINGDSSGDVFGYSASGN